MALLAWLRSVVAAIAARCAVPATTPPNSSPPNGLEDAPVGPVKPQDEPKVPEPTPPPPKPAVTLLVPFCQAIQSREGYYAPGQHKLYPTGTPAWRNKNPGNIKYGPFAKANGAAGQDTSGFAIFPTYDVGFAALMTLVRNAASGKSTLYEPTMTFLEFFQTYAPAADNNDPKSYAQEVARKLGVDINYQIKNLL